MISRSLKISMTALVLFSPWAQAESNAYELDTAHSKVTFSVPHLGISNVEGSFKTVGASIQYDPKAIEKSTLEAWADVASIDTADAKRDTHLKSEDFFDAAKFPKLTFKSKSVTKAGDKYKMTGDLSMHGITKPVTFDLVHKGDISAWGKDRSAFEATAQISREDFKMKFNTLVDKVPVVGDKVTIKIVAELFKDSAPAKEAKK